MENLQLPSNRKFGLFFTCVFMLIALYLFELNQKGLSSIIGILGGILLVTTIIREKWLYPLNRLWARLGLLLGMIFGPIVLGWIFFAVFTPVAMVMRAFGRDELRLKKTVCVSFWRLREPLDSSVESFKNQF